VSVLTPLPMTLPLVALALHAPLILVAAASLIQFAGLSIHLALWSTVFQREVPEHARSRVSAYDALGSFVLMPLGAAVAGPVAVAIGIATTLWVSVAVMVACIAAIAALPSVRAIRAPEGRDAEDAAEPVVAPPSITA